MHGIQRHYEYFDVRSKVGSSRVKNYSFLNVQITQFYRSVCKYNAIRFVFAKSCSAYTNPRKRYSN